MRSARACSLGPSSIEIDAGEEYDAVMLHARECRVLVDAAFDDFDLLLAPSASREESLGLNSTSKAVFNPMWARLGLPCLTIPWNRVPAGFP